MPDHQNMQDDINWLKNKLDSLADPILPSSLSAGSLFARLEELEKAGPQPEGGGWSPSLISALTGEEAAAHSAPVLNWKRWRPVLSAAAVFLLVAAVYWRGILPTVKGSGNNMAPQMSSTAEYDAESVESESAQTAEDSLQKSLIDPATGGGEAAPRMFSMDGGNQDNGVETGGLDNAAQYELAVQNIVVNVVMDDSATLTELNTVPAELFEKADYVVVAYLVPEGSLGTETPTTAAALNVTAFVKGNSAQEIAQITYTGGCVSVLERMEQMPNRPEENMRIMERDYGLSEDQINTGYIYTNVGNRPVIKTDVAYMLFLKEKDSGYFLIDSQYALLPVEDGTIKDFAGNTYGSVEKPKLR